MLSRFLAALVAAASVSMAMTPPGYTPSSNNDLVVMFDNVMATNGAVIAKDATQKAPTLGVKTPLTGTSYAVMMIDLDIPTNTPPATGTLLHWMQTGLTVSQTGTAMSASRDAGVVYMLQNSGTAAPAPYFGPSPPARVPLSHRYTQILVDTSAASQADMAVLQQAAKTRNGFSALQVLTRSNMVDKVVAGNWFNVTNPGTARAAYSGASQTLNTRWGR